MADSETSCSRRPRARLMAALSPDPELQALREEWAPAWSIWRARRSDDPPEVRRGEFVASRMDDAAGTDRTLMRPTAVELDKALRQQGQG